MTKKTKSVYLKSRFYQIYSDDYHWHPLMWLTNVPHGDPIVAIINAVMQILPVVEYYFLYSRVF